MPINASVTYRVQAQNTRRKGSHTFIDFRLLRELDGLNTEWDHIVTPDTPREAWPRIVRSVAHHLLFVWLDLVDSD